MWAATCSMLLQGVVAASCSGGRDCNGDLVLLLPKLIEAGFRLQGSWHLEGRACSISSGHLPSIPHGWAAEDAACKAGHGFALQALPTRWKCVCYHAV